MGNLVVIHEKLKLNALNRNRIGQFIVEEKYMHETASCEWRSGATPTNGQTFDFNDPTNLCFSGDPQKM
jgi:hypothetical protein